MFTAVAAIVGAVWPDDEPASSKHAVWLFGFSTVRVDLDDPSAHETVPFQGFGEVAGTDGYVVMYDASTGRVGVVDATDDTLRTRPTLAVTAPGGEEPPVPSLATSATRTWLVTGPGRVATMPTPGSTPVSSSAELPGENVGATRVVNAGRQAIAVYAASDGIRAARLEASEGAGSGHVVSAMQPSTIVTVTADGNTVWVVGTTSADGFDAGSFTPTTKVDLTAAVPGGVATAVAYRGALWAVAREHADVVRIDPRTGRATARLRYLSTDRPFRQPTQLTTGHGSLWLLAPTLTETDRHDAEVLRISPAAKVQARINAPSSMFVGGLAVS